MVDLLFAVFIDVDKGVVSFDLLSGGAHGKLRVNVDRLDMKDGCKNNPFRLALQL